MKQRFYPLNMMYDAMRRKFYFLENGFVGTQSADEVNDHTIVVCAKVDVC